MRKVRQGLPAYLMPSREWIAQQARVSLSTVTRAFANMSPLGLLDIQERYRTRGNLRRQLTNLIRLRSAVRRDTGPRWSKLRSRPKDKEKRL